MSSVPVPLKYNQVLKTDTNIDHQTTSVLQYMYIPKTVSELPHFVVEPSICPMSALYYFLHS